MYRATVVKNDDCGIACSESRKMKRCGQVKCPIDCSMSEWSGWSKCSAECEGGVQSRTRSILYRPRNGGEPCNTAQDSRPCNTQSCDRDCYLNKWSAWTPCSVACGGGFQEAFRHVLVPTRGEGKCPKAKSGMRYSRRGCNKQKCIGDEICIARQDLVIAVDGSGSVRAPRFETLKKFVTTLLERYQTKYYGSDAMKVGVVQFGNGIILPDGGISAAIAVQQLTDNIDAVKTAVSGLVWKKGFTNMAQGFAMAENLFIVGSRRGAQQAVLTITDGQGASSTFLANEKVEQLDDKGIQRFAVVVNTAGSDSRLLKQMKGWVSKPWETNLLHIPGRDLLEADPGLFAGKAITMFCPMSLSPSTMLSAEKSFGYLHVKSRGYCGSKGKVLSRRTWRTKDCAALAFKNGCSTFIKGRWLRANYCLCGSVTIDKAQYDTWAGAKRNPECADGWRNCWLWNFYAIEPED